MQFSFSVESLIESYKLYEKWCMYMWYESIYAEVYNTKATRESGFCIV